MKNKSKIKPLIVFLQCYRMECFDTMFFQLEAALEFVQNIIRVSQEVNIVRSGCTDFAS